MTCLFDYCKMGLFYCHFGVNSSWNEPTWIPEALIEEILDEPPFTHDVDNKNVYLIMHKGAPLAK